MSQSGTITSLSRLIELRDVEVERLERDVAEKEALRQRYHRNLDRMAELCRDAAASGALPPILSLNCANYKQVILQLMADHQRDLSLHEADMATAQKKLADASIKREVLDRAREQQLSLQRRETETREQKRQDELASQLWLRGTR